MPETLTNNHGIEKWTWANVMGDLRDQGGLDGVIIDPFSVCPAGCTGKYSGNHFSISWVKDVLLMLTMEEPSDTLVDAFTKVVNYSPFCRYMDKNGLPTVEWAKNDADQRFAELKRGSVYALVRIDSPQPSE